MSPLDWLFPPRCAGCRTLGSWWCPACLRGLRPQRRDWRPGLPLIAASRLEGPWQRAIHEFKYRPRPHLATALAQPLAAAATAQRLNLDALAFVPLHPARRRERGFNQSERLARALAQSLDCRLDGGLRRVRATVPQVGLVKGARRANLAGAIQWEGPRPEGRLGLVDDVYTTGATIEAAVAALEASGGHVVAILVLALREGAGLGPAQSLAPAGVALPESPGPWAGWP